MSLIKRLLCLAIILSGVLTLNISDAARKESSSLSSQILHAKHKLEILLIQKENFEQKKTQLLLMNQEMRQELHPFEKGKLIKDQQRISKRLKYGESQVRSTQKMLQKIKERINMQRTRVQSLLAQKSRGRS